MNHSVKPQIKIEAKILEPAKKAALDWDCPSCHLGNTTWVEKEGLEEGGTFIARCERCEAKVELVVTKADV